MSEIYWITVLGNLSNLFITMCVCFGLVTAGIVVGVALGIDEDDKNHFTNGLNAVVLHLL